jgi:hypothetical protein
MSYSPRSGARNSDRRAGPELGSYGTFPSHMRERTSVLARKLSKGERGDIKVQTNSQRICTWVEP